MSRLNITIGTTSVKDTEKVLKVLGYAVTASKPTEGACGYTTITIEENQ